MPRALTPARGLAVAGLAMGLAGRWYEAARPLSDGQGNPPPGWGNPDQPGTITLTSPARAIFRDAAGHRVEFLLRPGATGPPHLCS